MLCHQCALANPDDGRHYCERCHAYLAVTPGTGFKDLLQLSPEQFRTTLAQGLPLIHENVMTLWNEAQEIGKMGNRRAVGILQLFAEEEAAKMMLLFDAVRCPSARRDQFRRLLRGATDHLTKGIYLHVHLPLPEFVIRALDTIPKMSERFWLWTGNGKLSTASGDWQRRLLDLAAPAKVPNLHAHRFRDTFAVELLLKGVPLERVSILLGHSSVKVTEKHYSPWIRERQEQAEADVKRTWARDPVALMLEENASPVQKLDTQLLHGKKESAN